jgi:endonuclease YncB( thermonuclease family)
MKYDLAKVLITLVATLSVLALAGYFAWRRRVAMALVCMGCFFALLSPSVVFGGELCKPTRYADGDTFTFIDGTTHEKKRVRVKGFDAPERSQPYSKQATNKLRELTEKGADCECQKLDRYGRSVCIVRTTNGENVATAMLRAGFGCIDPRFENESLPVDREAGRAALAEAQAAKRGMWAQSQVQCAFDYRHAKKTAQ